MTYPDAARGALMPDQGIDITARKHEDVGTMEQEIMIGGEEVISMQTGRDQSRAATDLALCAPAMRQISMIERTITVANDTTIEMTPEQAEAASDAAFETALAVIEPISGGLLRLNDQIDHMDDPDQVGALLKHIHVTSMDTFLITCHGMARLYYLANASDDPKQTSTSRADFEAALRDQFGEKAMGGPAISYQTALRYRNAYERVFAVIPRDVWSNPRIDQTDIYAAAAILPETAGDDASELAAVQQRTAYLQRIATGRIDVNNWYVAVDDPKGERSHIEVAYDSHPEQPATGEKIEMAGTVYTVADNPETGEPAVVRHYQTSPLNAADKTKIRNAVAGRTTNRGPQNRTENREAATQQPGENLALRVWVCTAQGAAARTEIHPESEYADRAVAAYLAEVFKAQGQQLNKLAILRTALEAAEEAMANEAATAKDQVAAIQQHIAESAAMMAQAGEPTSNDQQSAA